MSELFLVSLVWGICETRISWMVFGSGISWIRVPLIIVGEGFVRLSVLVACSFSVSICSESSDGFFFCLVGWPLYIILVHYGKIWTALGKYYFIFVYWYTLVLMWNWMSQISCVVLVNPTQFNVLSYKIFHVFLLCFQRNVEKGYKSVILCWWWEFIVRFEINCYIAWNDHAFCAEGLH